MAEITTLEGFLSALAAESPDAVWLRDRKGDQFTEWTWREASDDINAVAAFLEENYGADRGNMAILSKNRAHWVLADLAIMASGNVSIPMFTTLTASSAEYLLNFTAAKVLILGEAENWQAVQDVLRDDIDIVTLPGVEIDAPHTRWDDIVESYRGRRPAYECKHDDLISIVFTSGTTGVPKGVMQTHDSFLKPMLRGKNHFSIRPHPRFLSYLPLSHIAERQLVMVQSIIHAGTVTFNESMLTLVRDMADTKPSYFFGPPRVWEQLQQGIIGKFGSREAMDKAMAADPDRTASGIRKSLGLDDADYLLTAAAPTPPALIEWYQTLGIELMEAFGQTELMAVALNVPGARKIGSIGRVPDDVELRISSEGELQFKAEGSAVGYYKMPEKTAETFVDGWVYTGDKGYVDEDGFVFLTGRVKDYFKTIQGKFVAPTPIENRFAENALIEQICLLGRGYSKTVIVTVLAESAKQSDQAAIEGALVDHADRVNREVDKHARIGAVIISREPWTIENELLTPTMKIKREEVERCFGERACELAHEAAVSRKLLIEWADSQA